MASELTPRERLLRYGPRTLSDAELVSVLLRNGCAGTPALEQADALLRETGGFGGLLGLDARAIGRRGFGRVKVASLVSAVEIGRRLARARAASRSLLDQPGTVAEFVAMHYYRPDQEVAGALYLNARNRLIADAELFRGTLLRAAVEPRALLKEGLRVNAATFILFHVHPSGDPTPSSEDLSFTRRVADAAALVGIPLADHIIVGDAGCWLSLRRRGAW